MPRNWCGTGARVALVLTACLISGCAGFRGAPEWNEDQNLSKGDPLYASAVTKFYAPTATNLKAIRNEFIETRSALIDRNYSEFKRSLHTERVGTNVGVDWSTLVLGSIAAAAKSIDVKSGAGALTAILAGGKSSVDKNVYFDRALPAMLAQMDARRAEIRNQLLNGMLLNEFKYPLLQAKADLQDYFDAGTITGAISQITAESATRQKAAEGALQQRTKNDLIKQALKEGASVFNASTSDTTKLFDRCIDPDKDIILLSIIPAVTALLNKYEIPVTPSDIQELAWLEEYETHRAELFSDPATKRIFEACKL